MRKIREDEKAAYDKITGLKENFGVFYKTCFHVHTPSSHDYTMFKNWKENDYNKAKDEDVYQECIDRNVFRGITLDDIKLDGNLGIYNDKKELLSFLLLAHEIYKNEIAIVVVADHHRIDGFKKLKVAIKALKKFKSYSVYPTVILGIEISCADKNHVVGIFEDNQKNQEFLANWLDENILNDVEGSFRTSWDVLGDINKNGGIGYLAHLDTSNIFKDKSLNGAYKAKLFSDEFFGIVGLSNLEKKQYIENALSNYTKTKAKFVLDNDSHNIDDIKNNHFWLKGSKRNYNMVREALHDYEIAVSLSEVRSERCYIKGLYIEKSNDGFLKGDKDEPFVTAFSPALNCFIGGRGTGKSSIIKILEYGLSQYCEQESDLEHICAHGNMWILYVYNNEEYLIGVRLPFKSDSMERVLDYFGQNERKEYRFQYYYDTEKIMEYTFKHYLELNKVCMNNKDIYLEPVNNKRKLIKCFFDRTYSVNGLVANASDKNISRFIYDTLFKNVQVEKADASVKIRSKSGLIKLIPQLKNVLKKRCDDVNSVLKPFNDSQKNIFRIIYSQDIEPTPPDIKAWLFSYSYKPSKWYKNKNILQKDIVDYLMGLCQRLGIWDFFQLVFTKNISLIPPDLNLSDFCTDMTKDMIENEIEDITSNITDEFILDIFDQLTSDQNISLIIDYLKRAVKEIEEFSLEFNVNSRAGASNTIFKDVRRVSLGQKVVAMLSFILGYSDYSKDYRPLIIDQPEDNLDNQYIYHNLVHQLRTEKGKRQVIIATHNSTIVTNAKAEQVCVMESDNVRGWIKAQGYLNESKIKKHIVNYLEGGVDSFNHKIDIYKDVL